MNTGIGLIPNQVTGWVAPAGSSTSFVVPGNWSFGTIWGRRDCKFEYNNSSPQSCLSGGCPGGVLECTTAVSANPKVTPLIPFLQPPLQYSN